MTFWHQLLAALSRRRWDKIDAPMERIQKLAEQRAAALKAEAQARGPRPVGGPLQDARRDQVRDLAQKLGRANALVNQHEATSASLNGIQQKLIQRVTNLEHDLAATERERDHQTALAKEWLEKYERAQEVARLRLEALEAAMARNRDRDGQIEDQADQLEELTKGIAAAREETRQERAARARAEQELAEATATIDGLGLDNAELTRKLEALS